jgi:small subunit ribosomal protein S18
MGNSTSKKPVRGRAPKDNGRKIKKKANVLAAEKIEYIDYKDINLLNRFMSDRSKIRGQRLNGATVQQQREVATAIKNAREMALLPYTKRVASVGRGPRGPRGPRGSEGAVDQVEEKNIDAVIDEVDTGIEFEAADETETTEEG